MKGKKAKKLDIRVQKTYDKLYKTFFELLAEKPYESITVLEICEATGIHRATFYKHFIDKQDFVNFCINQKIDELNLGGGSFIETGSKAYYISICDEIVNFIYQNKALMSDFSTKNSSSTFAEALENSISDYIEKCLNCAIAHGNNQFCSPVSLLSRYYAGALVALFKAWAADWEQYSKDDILRFIAMRYNELDYAYRHNKASQINSY